MLSLFLFAKRIREKNPRQLVEADVLNDTIRIYEFDAPPTTFYFTTTLPANPPYTPTYIVHVQDFKLDIYKNDVLLDTVFVSYAGLLGEDLPF